MDYVYIKIEVKDTKSKRVVILDILDKFYRIYRKRANK